MRIPKYLSPSALSCFEGGAEDYFLRYVVEPRLEREPQGKPASVGSAFDAYIKADLSGDPFDELFESQVEEQNRDFALGAGEFVYTEYKKTPAYKELKELVAKAVKKRFECTIEVDCFGVPLLGKPDCCLTFECGIDLILDWKVNGYCGKRTTSPNQGYRRIYNTFEGGRNHDIAHKNFKPKMLGDFEVSEQYMEDINDKWADQLCTYGWALDQTSDFIYEIHQVSAKPSAIPDRPLLRVSTYRSGIRQSYRDHLETRYTENWNAVQNNNLIEPHQAEALCRASKYLKQHYEKDHPIYECFRKPFFG